MKNKVLAVERERSREGKGLVGSRMKVRFLAGVNGQSVMPSIEVGTGRPGLGKEHELFSTFCDGFLELLS